MLLSTALLSCMHGLVRYVSHTLHPFEIAFFRNLFGLAVVLPLVWRAGAAGFVTKRPGLQVLRGVIGMGAMLGWFYGLSVVPIAGATALSFTAAIFASLGAALFLG
ncbi:MAG: EamA/RhaT family transporter, partial [Candidatus Competibacteraceae bacterium]|nr:EamA/RhaT family transporter [Candidatus Competibacteraceae bacterium]